MTPLDSPVEWRVEVAAGQELGEHPLWDDIAECLIWVDVLTGSVHRLSAPASEALPTGAVSSVRLGNVLGAVGLREGGGIVAAVDQNFAFWDAKGVTDRDPIEAPVGLGSRFNDAACDPVGRFLAGIVSESGVHNGQLLQVHADGHVDVLLEGLIESNGLAWSLDGATLYFVDSGEQLIRRYRYDVETGKIGSRQANLFDFPESQGTPDGLTIDGEGAIWVALWQGSAVKRISPFGEELGHIAMPVRQPTCPAFGGHSRDRLYVTSAWEGMSDDSRTREPQAGDLFSANVGVRGIAAYRFRG